MTSHHHIGQIKGSPQGAYSLEINNREFNYSDQLLVVVRGFYGEAVAHVSDSILYMIFGSSPENFVAEK